MIIKNAEFVKGVVGTDPILYNGLPQVVFVGRSNVGKSSIINSLVNRKELVRVGKKPGKTVEINFFLVNKKFYFVDMPGYGFAKTNAKEQEKIKKLILWYLSFSEVKPHLIVMILDVKAGFTDYDKELLRLLKEQNHNYIIVINKIDKVGQKELSDQLYNIKRESLESEILLYSTVEKKRNGDLLSEISQVL